jgi:hypothetical protein
VSRCTSTRELKEKFHGIDRRLSHHVLMLSQAHHLQMGLVLVKALTVFDKKTALNHGVLLLAKR